MADTVDVVKIFDGIRRQVVHMTNESDGTGEAAVAKVTIANDTDGAGDVADYMVVDLIEYSVSGFNYVVLEWPHTTPDEIAVLKGQGVIDFGAYGGKVDPKTTGGTGNLSLTTDGGADGSHYDISVHYRPKAT